MVASMPARWGAAPLPLLLAALAEVVGGSIFCADPSDFDGSAYVPGPDMQCADMVSTYFMPYVGLDSLTAAQCNATIVGRNISVSDALKYMSHCCGGRPSAEACGPLVTADKMPCASAADFQPMAPLGGGNCHGDENITDEATCVAAGYPEAWRPRARQQCDVGRINADPTVKQAACTQLGGTWVWNTCMTFMMAARMTNMTFNAAACDRRHPLFQNMTTQMIVQRLAATCCGSVENSRLMCEPLLNASDMPNPCNSPADFLPDVLMRPADPNSTCANYITLAFKGAYSATLPPVLCNFTAAECDRDMSTEMGMEMGSVSVRRFLRIAGERCCGGGEPTRACTPMQSSMPCAGGNVSRPRNVTCQAIKDLHEEHNCCRNQSMACTAVKAYYRGHACCGMPAKRVPAPPFMSR